VSWNSSGATEGEEAIDASLSRRVLQLASLIDVRLSSSSGAAKCDQRLEMALLYYFQSFRRIFMWENYITSALAHSSDSDPHGAHNPAPSQKQLLFQQMFEHMGLGDHATVVNMIVTKVGNNLKFWPEDDEIIRETLALFLDMTSGYVERAVLLLLLLLLRPTRPRSRRATLPLLLHSQPNSLAPPPLRYSSGKLLLTLDSVKYLLAHHTVDAFPSLQRIGNAKHRTTLHHTLTRLIFCAVDDMSRAFDTFIGPMLNILRQLDALDPGTLKAAQTKPAIVGVLRELRGVAQATHNRRTFGLLFDAIYPKHIKIFTKLASVWFDDPDVMAPLLKFVHEFVFNKSQRVCFDHSSPNGILLFRATSEIICAYGQNIGPVAVPDPSQAYRIKYKGVAVALGVLTTALNGNYVNFGVFALYNDKALESALEMALALCAATPFEDGVLAYPKLTTAYYMFFEIVFRNHLAFILLKESAQFLQILANINQGLHSLEATIVSQSAATIDHLATYYFSNQDKDWPAIHALKAHLALQPDMLPTLLGVLFNALLFGPAANHWQITRPVLSLMLADEPAFAKYRDHLVSTQAPENRPKLQEAFQRMLADINRNLEASNRDKFTQRMSQFRLSVRSFIS